MEIYHKNGVLFEHNLNISYPHLFHKFKQSPRFLLIHHGFDFWSPRHLRSGVLVSEVKKWVKEKNDLKSISLFKIY